MFILHHSLYYNLLGQLLKLYPPPPHFKNLFLSSNQFLQVSCVFVHVHVHVDTCMQSTICIVRCMCIWKQDVNTVFLNCVSLYILEAENLADPDTYRFFLPGWAVSPRDLICCPWIGLHMIQTDFYMGLSSELQCSIGVEDILPTEMSLQSHCLQFEW